MKVELIEWSEKGGRGQWSGRVGSGGRMVKDEDWGSGESPRSPVRIQRRTSTTLGPWARPLTDIAPRALSWVELPTAPHVSRHADGINAETEFPLGDQNKLKKNKKNNNNSKTLSWTRYNPHIHHAMKK